MKNLLCQATVWDDRTKDLKFLKINFVYFILKLFLWFYSFGETYAIRSHSLCLTELPPKFLYFLLFDGRFLQIRYLRYNVDNAEKKNFEF